MSVSSELRRHSGRDTALEDTLTGFWHAFLWSPAFEAHLEVIRFFPDRAACEAWIAAERAEPNLFGKDPELPELARWVMS